MSQIWLSLTVEGEPLTNDGGEPLTDWRIVALPPLVIQNQLPVTASLLVWEEPQVPPPLHIHVAISTVANMVPGHIYCAKPVGGELA